MRMPYDENRSFSKAFSNIKFVADTSKSLYGDILDVWFCKDTGTIFGYYVSSGLRAITSGLAYKLLKPLGIDIYS
jgi:uncharacterized protein YrrD